MNAKRTPGPWEISTMDNTDLSIHGPYMKHKHGSKIADAIATVSCGLNSTQAANAAFIVTACNSHDALVEALENLFEHCEMIHRHWGDGCNLVAANNAIDAARAALRAAKGEQR